MTKRIFAIGDLHLSFASEKPMDVFGPLWERHDERVAAAWRKAVTEDDLVLIVGDTSWALKTEEAMPDLEWIRCLPGKKILIRGNHDLWWQGIKKLNALWPGEMLFLQNDSYFAEEGFAICGSRGWGLPGLEDYGADDEKILDREIIRLGLSLDAAVRAGAEEILVAMHFPPALAPSCTSVFTDLFEKYPQIRQVVYGHLHGPAAFGKGPRGEYGGILYQLVSLDYLGCTPALVWPL
ncbi:MAG: metallophosphoesterase [Clostridiales Family XIII bacterium]|jgi:predicted phosphohydrolase|nr:metallophosphoesterase [Clostridiales Family XIII bacterium]